jgi:hypothetical protein
MRQLFDFFPRWFFKGIALSVTVLLVASGCQAVFGDFSIDTSTLDARCLADSYQCDDAAALDRCRSDGSLFEFVEQCANQAFCNAAAGTCTTPPCNSGATRCAGAQLEDCSDDQSNWVATVPPCASGTYCDVAKSTCTSGTCLANATRCNDSEYETCVGGAWTQTKDCATAALCSATGCMTPTCAAGQQQCGCPADSPNCDGSVTLETCLPGRNGWSSRACSTSLVCNATDMRCEPPVTSADL